MSSLWTPDGERPVRRDPTPDTTGGIPASAAPTPSAGTATPSAPDGDADGSAGDPLRAAAAALGLDLDALDDEEREQLRAELEEMMQVRRQVGQTPVSEVLARHLMQFGDLVTIYLEAQPPAFAEAAVVIETLRGALDGAGDGLGEHGAVLTEMLGQLQMIFVDVKRRQEV